MSNNRRHHRHEETVVTTYEIAGVDDQHGLQLRERPCWIRDISEGGALIQTESEIPVNTPIILHLTISHDGGDDVYLSVRGEVRWARPTKSGRPFRVGVEFKAITDEHAILLKEYLSRNLTFHEGSAPSTG